MHDCVKLFLIDGPTMRSRVFFERPAQHLYGAVTSFRDWLVNILIGYAREDAAKMVPARVRQEAGRLNFAIVTNERDGIAQALLAFLKRAHVLSRPSDVFEQHSRGVLLRAALPCFC